MHSTYRITTLGCKVNQQESGAIAARFEELGFLPAGKAEAADVCVINSCTVSSVADSKTRQKIRHARAANPGALICVIGCLPQVARDAMLEMPEIDLVIGTFDKGRTAELVMEALEMRAASTGDGALSRPVICIPEQQLTPAGVAAARAERTRAYIKAEDGCDRFCAYCIIPYARGPVRSKPLEEMIIEAKALLDAGYRELVLTGVNLALYGKDLNPDTNDGSGIDLRTLSSELCTIDHFAEYRVRLGSLEPAVIDKQTAVRIAETEGICPQFHLSLQSGSEHTLMMMGRPYTPMDYEGIVEALRGIDPLFSVTTDVIVGFPGETNADFEESLAFVKRMRFAHVHVFKYSRRPGTLAADMPDQISDDIKRARSAAMIEAAEEGRARFLASNMGQARKTLIYGPDKSGRFIRGLTDNGIDIRVPVNSEELISNHFKHIVLKPGII